MNTTEPAEQLPMLITGGDVPGTHATADGTVVVLCIAETIAEFQSVSAALADMQYIRLVERDATLSLSAQIQRDNVDAVLCCLAAADSLAGGLADALAAPLPQAPILVLADPGTEERADEAILLGAYGYLIRTPHFASRLGHTLRTVARQHRLNADKRRTETSLQLVTRARRVMAECNRVLLRATDEQSLLDDMCRIVVDVGGYPMVWIGWPMHDARRSIWPVARHGNDQGYLDSLDLTWAADSASHGLAGAAICTAAAQVARNVDTDPRIESWRNAAVARGFRAVCALPLVCGKTVVGVMSIYANEEDAFDAAELELLEELCGDIAYGICNLRTQREKQLAEAALKESQSRFEATFSQAAVGIAHVDLDGRFLRVNPTLCSLLGYSNSELQLRAFHDITYDDDLPASREYLRRYQDGDSTPLSMEKRYVRKDGSIIWVSISISRARTVPGESSYLISVFQDISSRKAFEQRLEFHSNFDSLTQLPNRRHFGEELERALARASQAGQEMGVVFLDLDRFKDINDTYGHAVADNLLVQVARRLEGSVRTGSIVGRLGGDEFAVVVPSLVEGADEGAVAQRLLDCLHAPFELDGELVTVSASVGLALYPIDGISADALLRHADTAMYVAKQTGRGTFRRFRHSMNGRVAEFVRLESELHLALERGEFHLHYQPKFTLSDGSICGLEALLRWNHPERGLVAPAAFIPVLESSGLINRVGEWILRSVCAQSKAWRDQGIPVPSIALNVSARQFQQRGLDQSFSKIIAEYGLSPSFLELELTESVLMSDAEESVRMLSSLKASGLRLSVDDFGTGYSSLAYLSRFPVDSLKIDRTFVSNVTTDATHAAITSAVIKLAHSLNMRVIAEGVETQDQLDFLSIRGCDEVQGYVAAPPLTVEQCTRALYDRQRLR